MLGFAYPKWKGRISKEVGDYSCCPGLTHHHLDQGTRKWSPPYNNLRRNATLQS